MYRTACFRVVRRESGRARARACERVARVRALRSKLVVTSRRRVGNQAMEDTPRAWPSCLRGTVRADARDTIGWSGKRLSKRKEDEEEGEEQEEKRSEKKKRRRGGRREGSKEEVSGRGEERRRREDERRIKDKGEQQRRGSRREEKTVSKKGRREAAVHRMRSVQDETKA